MIVVLISVFAGQTCSLVGTGVPQLILTIFFMYWSISFKGAEQYTTENATENSSDPIANGMSEVRRPYENDHNKSVPIMHTTVRPLWVVAALQNIKVSLKVI